MKFGIMGYGKWFSYFFPRALLINPKQSGFQMYRWLKFYIRIDR